MDLTGKIQQLKKEYNAAILAHNYQLDEVQQVADYVGDSFYLSKVAAEIDNEVIVFCGVKFMAETAKILSPHKTVLLPVADAGCPLADMLTLDELREVKAFHHGIPVVCYVNSSAEVKAESDVCCTSANAVKVVAALPSRQVIFVPDGNLGRYVAKRLPDKELILVEGCCPVHNAVKAEDVRQIRLKYPDAELLVHPECTQEVVESADFVGSTSQIIAYAGQTGAKRLIIGTEQGVLYKLKTLYPDKEFVSLHAGLLCPDMKKTTLETLYAALAHQKHNITVDKATADRARRALQRMLEMV
ncbi:MAG: quinolinate synthase NadA [Negativicutes bacterium]|nr:quinolinate synthase NadA [Negativicutes bacterium]